jgi:cysteine desulfurase/selenocysteine lyase
VDRTDTTASVEPFDAAAFKAQFPALCDPSLSYLDNAATSQLPQHVLDRLNGFETRERANVHGGVHRLARAALAAYEGARATLARYINAQRPEEVVFTYGATSSINLAAHSFGELLQHGDEVVLSVLEHHSNLLPWQQLAKRRGVVLRFIPVTPEGRMDLGQLDRLVTQKCRLVAVTHCSNVTGTLTDVAPLVQAARAVGARVLLDGAQRVPHGPIDVQALGVDFYALSGHKMFAPTGIGALWARLELLEAMPPFMVGGQMIREVTLEDSSFADPPRKFEAGTPPIAGAIGLGAAAAWLGRQDWPAITANELRLTGRMLDGLARTPGARLVGPPGLDQRRGVVSFQLEGHDTETICRLMDRHGVALRSGHHCAQPLLRALGIDSTARASLAPYNTDEDVDAFLTVLDQVKGYAES